MVCRIVGGGIGSSSASIKIADILEQSWRINGDVGVDKLSEAPSILLASVGCQMLPYWNFPKDENVEFYRNMIWRKLNRDFHFSLHRILFKIHINIFGHVQKIIRFGIFCLVWIEWRNVAVWTRLLKLSWLSRWHLLGIDSIHWLFGSGIQMDF